MKQADQAGLAIAHARNGNHYANAAASAGARRTETAIELSYLTQAAKHVTVQPDLQYVVHPNTDRSLSNARVLALRLEVAF